MQPRLQKRLQNKIAHFRWRTALVCWFALVAGGLTLRAQSLEPVAPRLIGATVAKEDAAADIDFLFDRLEQLQPKLYATRTRDDVMAARKRMIAGMTQRVRRDDLWIRLGPLVASLNARVALLAPDEEVQRRLNEGELYFPNRVSVKKARGSALQLVLSDAPANLKDAQIIEVNSQAAEDLLFRFSQPYAGSALAKSQQVAATFSDLLMLYGIPAPFEVLMARAGGHEHLEHLAGVKCEGATLKIQPAKGAQMFRLPHSMLAASVGAIPSYAPRTCATAP